MISGRLRILVIAEYLVYGEAPFCSTELGGHPSPGQVTPMAVGAHSLATKRPQDLADRMISDMPIDRMRRLWRHGIAEMVIGYLSLELLLLGYQLYLGPGDGLQRGNLIFWFPLVVFLLWRIWRSGRTSWWVLVVLNSLLIAELIISQVWPWGWYATGLLAIVSAQLLLLLSPAVRRHHPKLSRSQ